MLQKKRQEKLLGTLSWKAERDADRAMADTAASHQRKSCEPKTASLFHPIHGFVVETLERDMRFRVRNDLLSWHHRFTRMLQVHEALVQCGLHRSPYAKQALLLCTANSRRQQRDVLH